jgi:hypothetical protein
LKTSVTFLETVFLLIVALPLVAQTNTDPWLAQLTTTNGMQQPSYTQQLNDFQKSETERILSQKLIQQTEADKRERRVSEEKARLARLEKSNRDLQQRKDELEEEELNRQLKEQLLGRYIRKLQMESSSSENKSQLATNPENSTGTISSEAAQTPTPQQLTNANQESIKEDFSK